MFAAILPFFTGAAGKAIGIGLLVIGLLAGGAFIVREHDNSVRAAMQVAELSAQTKALQAQGARNTAALEAVAQQTASIAANINSIRGSVNAAPHISACVGSPAIGAALDGLRQQSAGSGNGAAAADPAIPLAVPAATPSATVRR